tara:strand:+ start:146 stop:586 length:441 start_codon:yes stop_codon:yes gene_type:complete
MEVFFREVDPFNCWIWLKFVETPGEGEKKYIDGIFDSWYVLGRLGGFNSGNLQANDEGAELSWFSYDQDNKNNNLPALMHNVGQVEFKENWARCWVDMGTSDAVAFDVLINSLTQVSSDLVEIQKLYIGGVNDDWTTEVHPDAIFQ